MVSCLLFIALTNLGLGFYLGAVLLRPVPKQELLLASSTATIMVGEPAAEHHKAQDAAVDNEQTSSASATDPYENAATAAKSSAGGSATWNRTGCEIRHDMTMLRDRIRYALTANDKKINKELAFELQSRTVAWQKLLQEKLAADADNTAPELCLAQIETLQTNLKLLDWSEASESILKKIEREIEAVKNVLPPDVK